MKYYVKTAKGGRIKCFGKRDADKIAQSVERQTGNPATIIRVPVTR